MKNKYNPLCKEKHHGIVLDVSSNGFDRGSVDFGSIFTSEDDPDNIFLFYSGTPDTQWAHSYLGLAVSNDGYTFRKITANPILDYASDSFHRAEALTPAITRIGNRFYMVFSGRPSPKTSRRIGMAYADDPKGPWHLIGVILKPTSIWEGLHIDNGPTLLNVDEKTFLVFYSNLTTYSRFDIHAFLRRYPRRMIGIAKVRISGPSLSEIEVYKLSINPLKHLNGAKGSWNESVFCPGYFKLNGIDYLLPVGSTYSVGSPYRQYIGIASSNSPYFEKGKTNLQKLVDGPHEKAQIIPNIKSQIALDSPSPLLRENNDQLFLYYSVADRFKYAWRIALTTFSTRQPQAAVS